MTDHIAKANDRKERRQLRADRATTGARSASRKSRPTVSKFRIQPETLRGRGPCFLVYGPDKPGSMAFDTQAEAEANVAERIAAM